MVQAVRVVSVQRGVDPAGLALVAFGGAGPLHACALAEALGMPAVVVPPRAGVLSAVGMLGAPRQVDLVRSWPDPADHAGAEAAAAALAAEAGAADGAAEAPSWRSALDCRYAGQSHELTVPDVAGFEAEHARRNGFVLAGAPVEVVAIRASARWPSPVDPAALAAPGPERAGWSVRRSSPSRTAPSGWRPAGGRRSVPSGCVAARRERVDAWIPPTLQVLISQLTGVATEMGVVLRRSSLSPNIKERADCSAAVFTAAGELLVQAEHIPVHLGSMPASVEAAIGAGLDLGPGDQVVLNDPFAGGTHLNDVTLVAPCHAGGRLIGWVANRAHHADVGGMAPGSIPPEAVEIYQEGLRIPPVRLTAGGGRPPAGELADARRTARRPRRPGGRQPGRTGPAWPPWPAGRPTSTRCWPTANGACGPPSRPCPDGTWQAEDVMDSTGPAPGQQRPVAIRLRADHRRALRSRSTSVAPSRSSPATSMRWRR